MTVSRITAAFDRAKSEARAVLVGYFMAGDPDLETSFTALDAMARNGADILEIGAPFTDPMADGPAIQRAALRSLASGTKLKDVLALAARLRGAHPQVPLILMGYANPVHAMGIAAFTQAAKGAGLDGAIIVDLPPEEDAELRQDLASKDLAMIRLATPTSTAARMAVIANGASGFIYYVSVAGITGAGAALPADIAAGVAMARRASGLPVVVGFGVRTAEQVAGFAAVADGVVVGSALVEAAAKAHSEGRSVADTVGSLTATLATGLQQV